MIRQIVTGIGDIIRSPRQLIVVVFALVILAQVVAVEFMVAFAIDIEFGGVYWDGTLTGYWWAIIFLYLLVTMVLFKDTTVSSLWRRKKLKHHCPYCEFSTGSFELYAEHLHENHQNKLFNPSRAIPKGGDYITQSGVVDEQRGSD